MLRLTDLREILRYVPRFRDKVFVIAIDGAVVEDENFQNLLLDIALLRNLNVRVALVHGAAKQIRDYATRLGVEPSDVDGTGVTDASTLQIAITAANRVTHEILEGLTANDLRGACPNAVVAHPAGILGGVDKQFTGRVERVDGELLDAFLAKDIIPVVPPIGIDGVGRSYRLNSDAVAVELAKTLRAVKLIYLTTEGGVKGPRGVIRQLTVEEAEAHLKRKGKDLSAEMATKLTHAVRAGKEGIERIHIIDGREQEGLLGEVFSNEGIGTLVYTNEYQAIRPAQKKDVRAIYGLIQQGIATDELAKRSRADVERQIGDFYVFEIDRNPVACVSLLPYPEHKKAELACLFVDERYANRGIGAKLISYVEARAKDKGFGQLLCLSTQAVNYFTLRGGFGLGSPDDLPPARREAYDRNGRKSQVLIKSLPNS
jgi:amino-acid N-acetyltransferase